MARKTVPVAAITARVNAMMAAPGSGSAPRAALAVFLETVLMDTGNYHGFRYLQSEYLPAEEQDYANGHVLRPGYDDTRRYYF